MMLGGLRVLDLSMFLPGPFLTQAMADHGADVIRIEPLSGEPTRKLGPFEAGQSVWFANTHRHKKSLALNLKSDAGRDIFLRLADSADVIVEAFRPGVVDRLGIGYQAVSARNERIAYCALSAFGQTGPLAGDPAHDIAVQARTGLLAVNDGPDGRPVVPGAPAADMAGSYAALSAILMALYARDRPGGTGRGDYLDIAMFDSLLAWTVHLIGPAFVDKAAPRSAEQRSIGGAAFYNVYETADGKFLVLGGREPKFVRTLLTALGRADLIAAAEGPPGAAQQPVKDFLAETFRTKSRDDWAAWFAGRDVAFAPVFDLVEAMEQPHVAARGLTALQDGLHHLATPLRAHSAPARTVGRAPGLGEHAQTLLTELGFGDAEIERLRTDGVIAADP